MLSGVETAGFLEATALYAQSITEIHGIPVVDRERARTLVMTMMLGNGGQDLIRQFAGQVAGGAQTRSAFWGELVTKSLPSAAFASIADRVQKAFLRKFAVTQGSSVIGRAIPFGIGAVIGGGGNHLLGRRVVTSSRTAFGPAPASFPESLDAVVAAPKTPRLPKTSRVSKAARAAKDAAAPTRRKLPRGRDRYPMLPPPS